MPKVFFTAILMATAYVLTGILGLQLAVPPGYASPLWPPAGIALGAVLLWGRGILPGIFIGSFALNLHTTWRNTPSLQWTDIAVLAAIASGATLQAFTGHYFLKRLRLHPNPLNQLGATFRFQLVSGPLVCLIAASVGVGALYAHGLIPRENVLFSWWNWWIGDCLGTLVFTPITLILFGQPRPIWRPRFATVAMPMILGLVFTIASFLWASWRERQHLRNTFEHHSHDVVESLRGGLARTETDLRMFAAFFKGSGHVSSEEFNEYADALLRQMPHLRGIGWANCPPDEPCDLVYRAQDIGPADLAVLQTGHLRRASPLDSGLRLLSQGQGGRWLLTLPAASRHDSAGAGYLVIHLDIHGLVRKALPLEMPRGVAVKMLLAREMHGTTPALVFAHGTLQKPESPFPEAVLGFSHAGSIRFADDHWLVYCHAETAFVVALRTWAPWAMLAGGLLIAALLGSFLLVITGRTQIIAELVDQGTVALKQANGRLKRNEAVLRQTGLLARVGGWSYDVQSRRLSWSNELLAICELDRPFSRSLAATLAVLPHETSEALKMAVESVISQGHAFDLELPFVTATGKPRWARFFCEPMRENGATVRLIGGVQDITDRKIGELELLSAKEAALAASRAKSQFLATVSHELRTPMNGVLGMVSLLKDTPLSADQADYLHSVQTSGEALLEIINDILDFSKLEAGKMTIEPLPFDLVTCAIEVCDLLAIRAAEKRLDLLLDYHPQAPRRLISDGGRMRQILINLVGNAVKFTAKGHVRIMMRTQAESDGKVAVVLEVEDTGIGIPAEKLGLLFQPFNQVDASTSRRFGGTGLGLAICHQLLDLMGGEIEAASSGEGSRFTVRLTLPAAEAEPSSPPPSLDPVQGPVFIDDASPARRKSLTHLIDGLGHGATLAETIGQAKTVLVVRPPWLAHEAIERVTALRATSAALNIIALSPSGRRQDLAALMAAGCSTCLTYPLDAGLLREALTKRHHDKAASKPDEANQERAALIEALANEPASPGSHGSRILLAEDNPVNQKVAMKMLAKLGCQIDVAGNGLEAIEMTARFPYDLVFMDVQMPECDGLTATQRIRALEKGTGRKLPIVAMTANAMSGDRELCLRAGMDDYVAKPIRPEELKRVLGLFIRGKDESAKEGPRQHEPTWTAVAQALAKPSEPT